MSAQKNLQLIILIQLSAVVFCVLAFIALLLLIYDYGKYRHGVPIFSNPIEKIGLSLIISAVMIAIIIYLQNNISFLYKDFIFNRFAMSVLYLFSMFFVLLNFVFFYKPTKVNELLELLLFLFSTICAIDQIRFLLQIQFE